MVILVGGYAPCVGARAAAIFAVLIVTIAGGCLFDTVGLVLAAPALRGRAYLG